VELIIYRVEDKISWSFTYSLTVLIFGVVLTASVLLNGTIRIVTLQQDILGLRLTSVFLANFSTNIP
jgi:hypothetical protein